eukprot:18684-Heterococcus_DN1.PRE.6
MLWYDDNGNAVVSVAAASHHGNAWRLSRNSACTSKPRCVRKLFMYSLELICMCASSVQAATAEKKVLSLVSTLAYKRYVACSIAGVLSELHQQFHLIRLLRQRQRLQQLYAMNGASPAAVGLTVPIKGAVLTWTTYAVPEIAKRAIGGLTLRHAVVVRTAIITAP